MKTYGIKSAHLSVVVEGMVGAVRAMREDTIDDNLLADRAIGYSYDVEPGFCTITSPESEKEVVRISHDPESLVYEFYASLDPLEENDCVRGFLAARGREVLAQLEETGVLTGETLAALSEPICKLEPAHGGVGGVEAAIVEFIADLRANIAMRAEACEAAQ